MGDSGGSVVSVDVERISFGGKVRTTSLPLLLRSDSLFLGCSSAPMGIFLSGGGGGYLLVVWEGGRRDWALVISWPLVVIVFRGCRRIAFPSLLRHLVGSASAPGRNRISWIHLFLFTVAL